LEITLKCNSLQSRILSS